MAAIRGVGSPAIDSATGAPVGDLWCGQLAAEGFWHVRSPVVAGAQNALAYEPYRNGFSAFRANGIAATATLDLALHRPWILPGPRIYPNDPLYFKRNPRQNPYIREYGARVYRTAQALVPFGVKSFALWADANILGLLPVEANAPPMAGPRERGVSPEVWGSLICEGASYARAGGAQEVHAGALLWRPDTGAYLSNALRYLRSSGIRRLPVEGVTLAVTGSWGVEDARQAFAMLRDTIAQVYPRAEYQISVQAMGILAENTYEVLAPLCDAFYYPALSGAALDGILVPVAPTA